MRGGVGERDIAQIFKIEPPGMKENKEKKGSEKKKEEKLAHAITAEFISVLSQRKRA